jgi:predicted PolB exonuclease-like 3'-5' exonuclease
MNLERRPPAYLIFDIETVPDIVLLDQYYGESGSFPNETIWNQWEHAQHLMEKNNITFPGVVFHSICSICALIIHPETFQIIDGLRLSVKDPTSHQDFLSKEKIMLESFWRFATKYKEVHKQWYDTLQSDFKLSDYQRKKLKPIPICFSGFNITGFDLPVVEHRSIKHRVVCPISEYGQEFGYDSYRSKFALDKTLDLLAFLHPGGGRMSAGGLQALALSLGLAGKLEGMDGKKVAEAFFKDKAISTIEEYCAVDVLITYGVFLAVQKFRGIISDSLYAEAVKAFGLFLSHEGKPKSYRELLQGSAAFFSTV